MKLRILFAFQDLYFILSPCIFQILLLIIVVTLVTFHIICVYIYIHAHIHTHTHRDLLYQSLHAISGITGLDLVSGLSREKKQMNGDYLNSINNEFWLSSWSSYLWWIWFQRLSEPDAPNYQGKSQFCQRIAPDVLAETSFYTSAIHLQLLFAYAVSIFNLLNKAFHFIQA